MSKRVLVIGGAGALAQHVLRWYVERDWEVMAVVRPAVGRLQPVITGIRVMPVIPSSLDFNVLITMTGRVDNAKLEQMEYTAWEHVLEDVLTAPALAIRNCRMKDGGNIVVVGSIMGSTGGYGCASYAAAKAGLVGLVRAAANEMAARNIKVNLLELGYVDAGMGARLPEYIKTGIKADIPLKRFARPDEVVDAVAYLGSVTYMTGNVLTLAGGLR